MWRSRLTYATLIQILVVFELVLSAMLLSVSYLTGNLYFKGVGIGLLISWVTSALAYFVVKQAKAGAS